jgi:hypothetical protein
MTSATGLGGLLPALNPAAANTALPAVVSRIDLDRFPRRRNAVMNAPVHCKDAPAEMAGTDIFISCANGHGADAP